MQVLCFAALTDLESVPTVKLKTVLYTCNVAVINDLAWPRVNFGDLEQSICGRDKFEVTCEVKTGSRLLVNALESTMPHYEPIWLPQNYIPPHLKLLLNSKLPLVESQL